MTDSTPSKRPVAPQIEVSDDPFFDERGAICERLAAKDQSHIYGYASSLSSAEQLQMRGLEVVKDENGSPIRNGMDFVVRKPRELHERQRYVQEESSARMAEKIIGNSGKVRKIPRAKTSTIRGF